MIYTRRFFRTQLGASALVSIAAMISFVLFAAGQQGHAPAELVLLPMALAQLA